MSEADDVTGTDRLIRPGKRKHEELGMDLPETRIMKIAKTTEISSSPPLGSEIALSASSSCPPECISLQTHSKFAGSLASMKSIRVHLSELTAKSRELKATMQGMREAVVDELLSHMRVRQLALGQIARPGLEDDMRELCLSVLDRRKCYMCDKEKELVYLEKLLGSHETLIELTKAACIELDGTIESRMANLQIDGSWGPLVEGEALPHMTRLVNFTAAPEGPASNSIEGGSITTQAKPQIKENRTEKGRFTTFMNLPFEIRLQIWRAALPGPRILTSHSHHNGLLTILSVCQESRKLAESHFARVLSPTSIFPQHHTPVLFINTSTDIVIRDLTIRDAGFQSLFSLSNLEFTTSCHKMLSGLSQVKRIALAYDVLRENGGTLFRSVQVCCPKLETLTVFPDAQLVSSARQSSQQLKFVELDSNLWDYMHFRWCAISERRTKLKAHRGLAVISTLFSHSLQYKWVFREYVESCGQVWQPRINVCLLASWDSDSNGWQVRSLAKLGDRCRRGFVGEDGSVYKGFVEAGLICGESGEELSRYDGLELLFGKGWTTRSSCC